MKKLFFLVAVMMIGKAGYGQQATPPAAAPAPKAEAAVLEWDSQSHDFGKIKQGTPVTHEFKFTNKGKGTLVITNVTASCGCTTPAWSKDPVPPGQQGFVKATYNAGAAGAFTKTVTVTGNLEQGSTLLTIKGEVITGAVQ
jgi:hypothetical protein